MRANPRWLRSVEYACDDEDDKDELVTVPQSHKIKKINTKNINYKCISGKMCFIIKNKKKESKTNFIPI